MTYAAPHTMSLLLHVRMRYVGLAAATIALGLLGNGFDPRDLAAYAAGVLAAVTLERAVPLLLGASRNQPAN